MDRRVNEVMGTLTRLGHQADPEQSAAVQNELLALQHYGQRLRVEGARAL